MDLLLLGRPDCPLCEEMIEALHEYYGNRLRLRTADVDTDAEWQRRYGLRIPVVLGPDGTVIFEGRLDPARAPL